MQSVGEVMAIGRTFPESLQKGLRSLEQGRLGLGLRPGRGASWPSIGDDELLADDRRSRRPIGSSRSASCCAAASRIDDDPRRVQDRPVVPRPDAA